jgi:L-ribulose-5-phosphate 3-epimerase
MNSPINRRSFVKTTLAATALAGFSGPALAGAAAPSANTKRSLKKGIMWGTVRVPGSVLEKMKEVRDAGFEGAEMNSHMNVQEVLKARDETGLAIPSVCCSHHWAKPLTHPDPAIREESIESTKQALREAKQYGASSILLVPGVVNKDTGYDEAYSRSQAGIRRIIPVAEDVGVKIAIENVWNHFLLSPLEAARYIDEFGSPMVGWHFDAGNILNYGWPDQWIRILGKRIVQFHVKEFSRSKRDKEGPSKGFQVKLLEGDVDWPATMKALDDIGYTGWAITEQGGGDSPEGLKDLADRLGRIIMS